VLVVERNLHSSPVAPAYLTSAVTKAANTYDGRSDGIIVPFWLGDIFAFTLGYCSQQPYSDGQRT